MPDLVAEVAAALDGLPLGSLAIVAVSGGADSAALALLTRRARPDLDLTAVHVRHHLRDDAADLAAARVVARAVGIAFLAEDVTVTPTGEGVEAAARAARYASLRAAAATVGATAVLVGHTAEDQAETVLLALGRGTGVRGLAGMRPVRIEDDMMIVRPLLRLRRADVRAVAAGLRTVEDPTNDDPDQRRQRVRADVLPALAGLSGGPGDPVALLTRLADLAREDADLLDELAAVEADRLIRRWGPVRVLPAASVAALPPALARRVVRTAIAEVRGRVEGLDAATVDRVLVGGTVTVSGGVMATTDAAWLSIAPADLPDLPEREVPFPGTIDLPEIGLRIETAGISAHDVRFHRDTGVPAHDVQKWSDGDPLPPRARPPRGQAGATEAYLDAGAGLVVRARRAGDRVPGSGRLLKDRMTDLGVPRAIRGLVPVVAFGDAPVWVPGIAGPRAGGTGVLCRLTRSAGG